ncbi:SufE family protein [Pararhizobium sp. LjRoot235]|uniref:SufE family protein n=1 Tax=Pararhizobium sp. LjRoot235 TaxID=3342291 RepID=UPI003ED16570
MTPLAEIVDNCSFLDDWQDRMSYVIELGRKLPEMPEEKRTAETKVHGCASQVWLVTHADGASRDPILTFEGESDAHIVRGLVAIVLSIFSGKPASDILKIDALDLFGRMGLIEYLTAQRANGLRSMVKRIKDEAARRLAA